MDLQLMLMATKAVGSIANTIIGAKNVKNVKKVGKMKKETAKMYRDFNKTQISKQYEAGLQNTFSNYANKRLGLTEQTNDVQSKINMEAVAQGVNLTDSSVKQDTEAQLDLEFAVNSQNLMTNTLNQASALSDDFVKSNTRQNEAYYNQISQIDSSIFNSEMQQQQNISTAIQGIGNTVIAGMDSWDTMQSKSGDYVDTNGVSHLGENKTFMNLLLGNKKGEKGLTKLLNNF